MKKTIYNVFVKMESQEQCDRMKQLCVDNNLPFWDDVIGFVYDKIYGNQFYFVDSIEGNFEAVFSILYNSEYSNEVTEEEFIKLLKLL